MDQSEKKRQRGYWEIAAALVTLGHRGVEPFDVAEIDRQLQAGREPNSDLGREIAAALRNYFNSEDGAPVSPPSPAGADIDESLL